MAGIGVACLLILIFPFVKAPVGFVAVLIVVALIAHRALALRSERRMSVQQIAGDGSHFATLQPRAARLIKLVGLTLALGYLIVLGGTYLKGNFLIDPQGQPIANDFVNVVAAGRLALDGKAAAAYDWPMQKPAEVRAIGHDFEDYYGWHYPPTFLFVAAALALLPYLVAAIVWLAATLAAYAAALGGILGGRAPASSSRSAFRPRSGTSPPGRTAFSPRR